MFVPDFASPPSFERNNILPPLVTKSSIWSHCAFLKKKPLEAWGITSRSVNLSLGFPKTRILASHNLSAENGL